MSPSNICLGLNKTFNLYIVVAFLLSSNIFLYFRDTKSCNAGGCGINPEIYYDKNLLDPFLQNLKRTEVHRVDKILGLDLESDKLSNDQARKLFFQTLAFPLQSICRVLKRIGGNWIEGKKPMHKQVDGDKFICLDKIVSASHCLIYSFGISNDWTFEDQMDSFGCKIYAYDHTINAPPTRGANIRYFKTGVGVGSDKLKTLDALIKQNNHTGQTIEYLKIDIEGAEWSSGGFSDWFATGALINVNQMALELHIRHNDRDNRQYLTLVGVLQQMYRLGFREVNMVVGPDSNTGYYHLVEIVFMKSSG